MKERYEGHPENKQETLKRDLLDGKIAPRDFLQKLFELDQSTQNRESSEKNAILLNDPEVKKKIEENEDARNYYANLASLSNFHVAQRKLSESPDDALPYLEESLRAAESNESEGHEQWENYVRATLAYFNQDLETLKSFHQRLQDGANKEIVGNLIRGLESTGEIDYDRDYRRDQKS